MYLLNHIVNKDDFTEKDVRALKNAITTFFNRKQGSEEGASEKEIESGKVMKELKSGVIKQELLTDILNDLTSVFDIFEIDTITTTPDSGKKAGDTNDAELKGFTLVVSLIASSLGVPLILPTVTRVMEKQKEQVSLEARIKNKIGAYSFKKEEVVGKNVLFIDDVLTSGATVFAIGQDVVRKGGNFYAYCLEDSEVKKSISMK